MPSIGSDMFSEFWKMFFKTFICIKKQRVHHCTLHKFNNLKMSDAFLKLPYTQQKRIGVVLQQRDSHSPTSCQIFETIQVLQQVSTSGLALFLLTTSSAKQPCPIKSWVGCSSAWGSGRASQGSRGLSQLSRWTCQGLSFTKSWISERKVKMQTHAWKLRKAPVLPGTDCQIQPSKDWMASSYYGLGSPYSCIWRWICAL